MRVVFDKERAAEDVFTDIYKGCIWGRSNDPNYPLYSGDGSHDETYVAPYCRVIKTFCDKFSEPPNVVDIGSGDFVVGTRIRPFFNTYTAIDVVPAVTAQAKAYYPKTDVTFVTQDVTKQPIPKADVALIRTVFQHLSNKYIKAALRNITPYVDHIILTEYVSINANFPPNMKMPSNNMTRCSFGSGVVLTAPPFNLQPVSERCLLKLMMSAGFLTTTHYQLR